jgi:Tfp pilus assembly protein PilV
MIEVVIAMGVLSIGMMGMAAMQTAVVKNNKVGNTYSQASTLARSQMELLKNGDITDTNDLLNPAVLPTTTSHPDNPVDENGQPGGIYNVFWTVDTYIVDTNNNGILDAADTISEFARTITVTVTFNTAGNDPNNARQVRLTSVTTGGGI